MAVIKGEGRVPILFGSLPLPVPPNRSAYLARPGLAGVYASVVVVPDESGLTPSLKALARHLARHGYAVFVPVVRPGFDLAVNDVTDAVDSCGNPGTPWASSDRLAIVGVGSGGAAAAVVAAAEGVDLLVLVGATLDVALLAAFEGSLLVVHGTDDPVTPGADVRQIHEELGRGEWVLYDRIGGAFFDEGSATFDAGSARDAQDRMVAALDGVFGVISVG